MFCIYCGSQTDNETRVCDACAAARTPVQPQEPNFQQQPVQPQEPYFQQQPVQPQEPYFQQAPQPGYQQAPPIFNPEPMVMPCGPLPSQANQANTSIPNPPSQSNKAQALAVKDAMGSPAALMSALFLTLGVLATYGTFFSVDGFTNNSIGGMIAYTFMAGILQILLVAGAWISYGSAKSKRELPITAGLKMVSAVGIVFIVLVSILLATMVVLTAIVAIGGTVFFSNFDSIVASMDLGVDLSFVKNLAGASVGIIIGIFAATILVLILLIVFYAKCVKNLGTMRSVLAGTARDVRLSLFAIVGMWFVAIGNIGNIINSVDILISQSVFEELTQITIFHTNELSAIMSALTSFFTILSCICGAFAMNRCRKGLKKAKI